MTVRSESPSLSCFNSLSEVDRKSIHHPVPSIYTGVSAAGVKFLLDYVYTSKLALSLANVQDVLSAASHLQV